MSLASLKNKKEVQSSPKGLSALKPKTTKKSTGLANLKFSRSTPKYGGGLAGLAKRKNREVKLIAKQDFMRQGIGFRNCKFQGPLTMDPICYMGEPGAFWSVDVTNGEDTITFHNRWGSWMSGGNDKDGTLLPGVSTEKGGGKDAAAWIAAGCRDRYIRELKALGLPELQKLKALREEEERQKIKKETEKKKLQEEIDSRKSKRKSKRNKK
jgi:hypothetical protein